MSACTGWRMSADVREIKPTPTGWRQIEATGQVSFACACGFSVRGGRAGVSTLAAPHQARAGGV